MTKKIAVVIFPNTDRYSSSFGKRYNFVTDIEDLNQGDTVVVDTVNGLGIAQFEKYDELGFGETGKKQPTKWIVQKVDLDAHDKRIEAALKLKKLEAMMEKKRKEAEKIQIYSILAKEDPEMAKLLEEYKKAAEVL